MDLSIQIVNYNTKRYLKDCLGDILNDLENSGLSYEILAVDNNSGDALDDLAEFYKDQPVKFFKSDHNGGYGAGNNFLAKQGSGKYMLILNPDIKFIEDNTIARLYREVASDSSMKVTGPRLLSPYWEPQWWDHGELVGKGRLAEVVGLSYWKNRKIPGRVAWVSGAFLMIKRAIFEGLGGFDEKFFHYVEDVDLCLRARNAGAVVWYNPAVSVLHFGGARPKNELYIKSAKKYFLEKHYSRKSYYFLLKSVLSFLKKI